LLCSKCDLYSQAQDVCNNPTDRHCRRARHLRAARANTPWPLRLLPVIAVQVIFDVEFLRIGHLPQPNSGGASVTGSAQFGACQSKARQWTLNDGEVRWLTRLKAFGGAPVVRLFPDRFDATDKDDMWSSKNVIVHDVARVFFGLLLQHTLECKSGCDESSVERVR
jgi:hypothetical protein